MTKHLMFVLALLTCIVTVRPTANAQQTKVDVPYNFVAAGKLLHAGTYTFTREFSPGALRLNNIDRKESGILMLATTFEPAALSDRTTLRFQRMGELYILSAVQTPWARYTFTGGSKAARLALKQLAASSAGQ
ncbi:MAG TPA: hypothetical protein VJ756_02980 [Terriglobales bacterium]|nr:hypothetical protein [Terriglobales bacterium]